MEGEGVCSRRGSGRGLELQAGLLMPVWAPRTGNRPMTGMVDVEREGLDDAELRRWVEQAAAVARSLPPKAKT